MPLREVFCLPIEAPFIFGFPVFDMALRTRGAFGFFGWKYIFGICFFTSFLTVTFLAFTFFLSGFAFGFSGSGSGSTSSSSGVSGALGCGGSGGGGGVSY
jgi:hypothetical protein